VPYQQAQSDRDDAQNNVGAWCRKDAECGSKTPIDECVDKRMTRYFGPNKSSACREAAAAWIACHTRLYVKARCDLSDYQEEACAKEANAMGRC